MRVLTLHQPWAWAIAHDTKRIENRTWRPPPSLVGKFIAIHAGVVPRTKAQREALLDMSREIHGPEELDEMVFGAVLAVARVIGCLTEEPPSTSPHALWWMGPCGWELDEVTPLKIPVACKGKQGLWELEPSDLASVRLQWKDANGRALNYEEQERLALQDPVTH